MNECSALPAALRRGGRARVRAATLGLCCGIAGYCSSLSAQTQCGTHVMIEDPIPGLIAPSTTQVRLTSIMTGLISPVGGAVAPGISNRFFVLDQVGTIWSIYVSGPRAGQSQQFLDLRARLVPLGLFSPL